MKRLIARQPSQTAFILQGFVNNYPEEHPHPKRSFVLSVIGFGAVFTLEMFVQELRLDGFQFGV